MPNGPVPGDARAIAVGDGTASITGHFQGTADFDPGPDTTNLISKGNDDVFVADLDTDGNLVRARQLGGPDTDQGRGIAVHPSGGTAITGFFNGTVDFDPGPGTVNRTSTGGYDTFVVTLDAASCLTAGEDNRRAPSIDVATTCEHLVQTLAAAAPT